MAEAKLEAVDIAVIVVYFVVVIAFGLISSLTNRGSVGGYFLAGRSMHFILIGASLFASNIGSGHFVGLAGSGATSGIGIAAFELNAIFILQILAYIFVPVYIASGVYTMPEYLRKRFGGQRIRVYLAVLALLLSIFTKVAADLFAGAVFLTQAFNWNIYAAIVILLAVAALFTITGGLTAVIWTDFIQTIIMLIGAFYLMIKSFIEIGGFEEVKHQFFEAIPNTTILYRMTGQYPERHNCGIPPSNSFNFMRSPSDPNQPWTGIVFGLTISSVWYWCTDQVIVQRTLAAKTYSHAKAGCILAGYLKFLPLWLIVVPGMVSRILYPDEIGCVDPDVCNNVCGSKAGCSNIAYPFLVIRLLPAGARGLMLAVMLSALMSSLTSVFNSSSTIFTVDIWKRFRPRANDVEVMIVSRVFVLVMTGIAIAWIPIVSNFSQLFDYIQSVTSFLAPPICAVYVMAVLWHRTNEQAAFWGLMIGLVIGVTRFAWESAYPSVACGETSDNPMPAIIANVHYLHFGMILFGIVIIVVFVISILTEPIADENLQRLLFWNRYSEKERVDLDTLETESDQRCDSCCQWVTRWCHRNNGDDNRPPNTDGKKKSALSSQDGGDHVHSKEPESAVGEEPTRGVRAKTPYWRRAVDWLCGIENREGLEMTEEQQKAIAAAMAAAADKPLKEIPLHFWLCTVNSILLLTFTIFFWGFFA